MKNSEFDQLLKAAKVPARDAEFWLRFPGEVLDKLQQQTRSASVLADRSSPAQIPKLELWFRHRMPRVGLGFALACAVVTVSLMFWHRSNLASQARQIAEAKKLYNELQEMFPNQIKSIVFNKAGASIDLAENADIPSSPPVYLKFCGPIECEQVITISGQRINLGGELFDVLVSNNGEVIVAGSSFVWANGVKSGLSDAYSVEAVQFGPKS